MSDPTIAAPFGRIAPTEANPEPLPPCGGSWTRDADGGLTPSDLATATRAGLVLEPAPIADTPEA